MTTPTTVPVRLQLRSDTAANWLAVNPVLLAGEEGLESDTGYRKVGNGSSAWAGLAYVSGLGAEIPVSRLADGAARQLLQTAANGTDVEWTSNIDIPGTLDVTGATTFDSSVTVQGDLRFGEATANGSNYVAFQAPAIVASNVTWTLPATDGTSGQALSTNGSGTLSWATAGGLAPYSITVTAVSKTLVDRERCTVTASGQTITLPATPAAGAEVAVTIAGTFTDTIIARNGENIMSLAENFTIDVADVTATLYYVDATRGWRII
jgi:hypothetical protein